MPSEFSGSRSGGGGGSGGSRGGRFSGGDVGRAGQASVGSATRSKSSPRRRNVMEQGGGSREREQRMQNGGQLSQEISKPVTPPKSKEEIASEKATAAQLGAIGQAEKLYKKGFGGAMEGLSPYAQTGQAGFQQWAKGIQEGAFTPQIKPFEFEADPSYQFRMQQGQEALQSSAAARGGALSGAALKELAGYGQQMASQEYGNAYNRYLQQNQLQQQAGQQAFQQGAALANVGLGTQQQLANIGMQQGGALSDLALQKGNVEAAGIMAPIDIAFQQQQLANQQQTMKNRRTSGILGGIGTALGGLGGFLIGGPMGAMAGASIGAGLGKAASGGY